jgi:hypothetical protein
VLQLQLQLQLQARAVASLQQVGQGLLLHEATGPSQQHPPATAAATAAAGVRLGLQGLLLQQLPLLVQAAPV